MAVKSKETQAFLNAAIPSHFGQLLWLGLTDRKREGDFKWIDGDANLENLTMSDWYRGEPNNLNNEDCVIVK